MCGLMTRRADARRFVLYTYQTYVYNIYKICCCVVSATCCGGFFVCCVVCVCVARVPAPLRTSLRVSTGVCCALDLIRKHSSMRTNRVVTQSHILAQATREMCLCVCACWCWCCWLLRPRIMASYTIHTYTWWDRNERGVCCWCVLYCVQALRVWFVCVRGFLATMWIFRTASQQRSQTILLNCICTTLGCEVWRTAAAVAVVASAQSKCTRNWKSVAFSLTLVGDVAATNNSSSGHQQINRIGDGMD